jgi:hypothetical protein
MSDKDLWSLQHLLNHNIEQYEKNPEDVYLTEEDYEAWIDCVKCIQAVLDARVYAENSRDEKLRELLRCE